jgi:dipeptidase D
MSHPLEKIEPKTLWSCFYNLTQIPRCSGNEAACRAHYIEWAKKHQFKYAVDKIGNILIKVPATKGYEKAPTVVMQGHMDMVGEKNNDVVHDFDNDPLQPYVDGDWVKAKGTTLGSDNGIGLAAAEAAIEEGAVHGPLELLFTVDEETGLTGASNLKKGWISGKYMLNLDSEEDGTLYIGCAGGGDNKLLFNLRYEKAPARTAPVEVKVSGLKGGHSGLNINENRGNALKLLARFLKEAGHKVTYRLAAIGGGDKHNAIPREASAVVYLPAQKLRDLKRVRTAMKKEFISEFGAIEPNLEITVRKMNKEAKARVLARTTANNIISALEAMPHGVIAMNRDIPWEVETSTNLASVKTEKNKLVVHTSSRSSVEAALKAVRNQILTIGGAFGAKGIDLGGYPGWQPDFQGPLLQIVKQVHADLFGKEPEVKVIHAGLECGIIGEKAPGIHMISWGPQIRGAHSPDERIQISSTQRFWKLVKGVLKALAAQ